MANPDMIGQATPGVFTKGWQYPITDPGAAVRNRMREQGSLGNPFNKSWMALVNRLAGSILPQFLAGLSPDTDNVESNFGDFITSRLNGTTQPWSMGQATQGLQKLAGILSSGQQALSGFGDPMSLSTPEGVEEAKGKALKAGALSPLQTALTGYLTDPEAQLKMFSGAYMPGLGPALTKGLGTAMGPSVQGWEDYGEATAGPTFESLLSMLLGQMGSPVSRPQMPMMNAMDRVSGPQTGARLP